MATPQFGYYDDAGYSAQPAYPAVYNQRPATVAPGHGHQSVRRKLPPLSTTPVSGRDERWASSYRTQVFNGAPSSNNHIRFPTASYPASHTTTYPSTNAYGYVSDPRCVSALSPQLIANDPRAVSPYGRSSAHAHVSPPTPPPASPIGSDEPAVKKKLKRADAAQLRVLNEAYAQTAFPSTEERLALAKALDMSPRSVQIWFQNKRQLMRQKNPQSSPSGSPRPTSSGSSRGFSDAGSGESHGSSLSSSQREWNLPSYDLPSHQVILKDLVRVNRVVHSSLFSALLRSFFSGFLCFPPFFTGFFSPFPF
ncbi:hypothetical protein B0H13DRAFT_1626084 [Mycena leptocephala]|nr:hypothetical protein B0H13DRAFT_1626084 [Mycena leptocephala]